MPIQLIHITLQYSNAVLLATLPYVSDFAKKLNLPIPIPVTTNHVQKFQPRPFINDVGGWLTLTNGYQFWFDHGNVNTFTTPRNFYLLQNPDRIPEFYGQVKMNKKEALELIRNTLKNLGYSEKTFLEGFKLEVSGPPHMGTNTIPFYRFEWVDPKDEESAYVQFEIDAENKKVVGLFYANHEFFRDQPKIDVPVELESDYKKRIQRQMRGETNLIFRTNAPQKLPEKLQKPANQ